MAEEGKHFVLVHGAGHGAWCWNVLIPLLRRAGHRVSAIDHAAAGINPVQIADITSLADYIEPLLRFMSALPADDRVVLVAHSAGGYGISVAMERFPQKIAAAVFISAVMPGPDLTVVDITEKQRSVHPSSFYKDCTYTYDEEGRSTSILLGPEFLAAAWYHLSPPEAYTLATLLVRPYPSYHDERSLELLTLTAKNHGSVPRTFIKTSEDLTITKEIADFMSNKNPPHEVKEIIGADHMPMYSKPQELCSILVEVGRKYK